MRNYLFAAVLSVGHLTSLFAQKQPSAILGEWMSPQKNSRVLIYQQGVRYFGKITWGTGRSSKDEKNPDPALRNRNLIGLIILNNFHYHESGTWKDGTIYDPTDGKTYSCKMTLDDVGNLNIRGYVGAPLFGRTEVWTKFN